MDREYDVFEKTPNGEVLWREVVVGYEAALVKLKELAAKSRNEWFAMHTPTQTVVARANETPASNKTEQSPAQSS